ncbi:Tll0287-like domain-containing protein [Crocosphaera sp. Alani8]|uniref:Tll0287-like domain-containing protein n=1 Tax=Crocosphaera sp. Alani8 TaxID=3038952 RepID=UPI00313C4D09
MIHRLIRYFRRIKLPVRLITLMIIGVASWFVVVSCGTLDGKQLGAKVPADLVADYIYRIIWSERTIYGKHVVQRLKDENVVMASEHWQQEKSLPLPAQMFRMSSELASENSAFSYGAISPWSLNQNNSPNTEFEERAMQNILETGLPYKDYQVKDGKKYFSALYPDKAVSAACIDCHNQHPVHKQRYPQKVFKVGDVMGGILVNLPIEN